jgi:hypothetical protein
LTIVAGEGSTLDRNTLESVGPLPDLLRSGLLCLWLLLFWSSRESSMSDDQVSPFLAAPLTRSAGSPIHAAAFASVFGAVAEIRYVAGGLLVGLFADCEFSKRSGN